MDDFSLIYVFVIIDVKRKFWYICIINYWLKICIILMYFYVCYIIYFLKFVRFIEKYIDFVFDECF